MANNKAELEADYQCGYCLSTLDEMIDPRLLPCHHVFCLTCLKMQLLIHQLIECPSCKVSHRPTEVNLLDKYDGSGFNSVKNKVPCDSCSSSNDAEEEKTAILMCSTCDLRFCETHSEMHSKLTCDKHKTQSLQDGSWAEESATDIKRKPEICSRHGGKEVTLVCETCNNLLCTECEKLDELCPDVPSAAGSSVNRSHFGVAPTRASMFGAAAATSRPVPGPFGSPTVSPQRSSSQIATASTNNESAAPQHHKLRSLSFMVEKITTTCQTSMKSLHEKEKAIAQYDKILVRSLSGISERGEKMLQRVDQITDEQVKEIRSRAEDLKNQIQGSLSENATLVNEASEGMMEKQNSIAKLRFKVGDIKRMEKVSEMIRESQKTQANVAKVEKFSIKRCHLGESVLIPKKTCRDIEVATRASVPTSLGEPRGIQVQGTPHSIAFFGESRLAVGCNEHINIIEAETSNVLHQYHCTGLRKLAVNGGMIYGLCYDKMSWTIRPFTADLQATRELALRNVMGDYTNISVTSRFIALLHKNGNIHVYDKEGNHQIDITRAGIEECVDICATEDGRVLCLHQNSLSRFQITTGGKPIWTSFRDRSSSDIPWTSVTYDDVSGITFVMERFHYGNRCTFQLISTEGEQLKKLQGGCWDPLLVDVKSGRLLCSDNSCTLKLYELKF